MPIEVSFCVRLVAYPVFLGVPQSLVKVKQRDTLFPPIYSHNFQRAAMADIYNAQLTARGGVSGRGTIRGTNHFLNQGDSSKINLPLALKSSRSNSVPTLHSQRRRKSDMLSKQRVIAETKMMQRAQLRALNRMSARSDAPATAHLTKEHFRTEDLKLNKAIASKIRKKNLGVGSRLLAPDEPTSLQRKEKVQRMEQLKETLLQQLEQTDVTLKEKVSELEKRKSAAAEQERRMQESRARSRSKQATLDDLKTMNMIGETMKNAETIPVSSRASARTNFMSARTHLSRARALDDDDGKSEVIDYMRSTSAKFPPYVGEAYDSDYMKSSYLAYNDQEFGVQPEYDKVNKVRLIAGGLYSDKDAPEGYNDKPESTIYFPFKGHDPNEKKPRRSRSTAKCLLLPGGGYGTMIIDKRSRRRGQFQHRPSRWPKMLETSLTAHTLAENAGEKLDESQEREFVKQLVRAQTRAGPSLTIHGWKPTTGGKCMARYPGDKEWYLAKIEKIRSKHLEVRFMSRGNSNRCVVSKKFVKPVVYDRPYTAGFEGL
jgi:hypothetical protein